MTDTLGDLEVVTYRPTPQEWSWAFGPAEPVRRIRPGTVLEVYTEDCFGGNVTSTETLASRVCEFPFINPQTGPFYVEGAEPGDTLAIHFVSIEPSRDWAASYDVPAVRRAHRHPRDGAAPAAAPRSGLAVRGRPKGPLGHVPREARRHSVQLPLDPMHGTVGLAPASFEARSSLVPDSHGGNMDTPEMRAGVTCFLGVNVEGALFSIGDGHCRQGEGEACGVAVEAAMDTVVVVDVIKGEPTPWPRFETDDAPDEHRLRPAAGGRLPDLASTTWSSGCRRVTASRRSTRTS